MFIQERGEELIERFSLRFSYCSYTFHHHYVNQRQYHFIWKVFTSCRQHLTVHCKHKREKDNSLHQWICFFFFPYIKLYHNIFALSNKLWIVSCCVSLQLNLTQVHDGPKARNTYRNVKRHSSMPFPLLYWTILPKYVSTNHEIKRSSSLSCTSSLHYGAPAERVDQNAEAHTITSRETLFI